MSDERDEGGDVQLVRQAVSELSERLRLAEKQLMKTHRIAVEAHRAAKPLSTELAGGEVDSDESLGGSTPDADFDQQAAEGLSEQAASDPDQPLPPPTEPKTLSSAKPPEPPPHPQTPEAAPPATPPASPPASPPAAKVDEPPQATPIGSVPPAVAQANSPTRGGDESWEAALLGPELASTQGLAADRNALLSGLRYGEPAAGALVGALLVFRNSAPDRKVQQLKDVGEAYYRWRPETAGGQDLFRQALIATLHAECEQVGVANRIELVQPGDRFDAARHHSKDRGGMEVVDVQGWVVLRENGKPYSKANVTVR